MTKILNIDKCFISFYWNLYPLTIFFLMVKLLHVDKMFTYFLAKFLFFDKTFIFSWNFLNFLIYIFNKFFVLEKILNFCWLNLYLFAKPLCFLN
jgi:hypothetical protein